MTLYCTPTTHPTSEASSSELLWVAECHDPFAPFEKFGATARTDSYNSDIFPANFVSGTQNRPDSSVIYPKVRHTNHAELDAARPKGREAEQKTEVAEQPLI
jgi:hypothetical protein